MAEDAESDDPVSALVQLGCWNGPRICAQGRRAAGERRGYRHDLRHVPWILHGYDLHICHHLRAAVAGRQVGIVAAKAGNYQSLLGVQEGAPRLVRQDPRVLSVSAHVERIALANGRVQGTATRHAHAAHDGDKSQRAPQVPALGYASMGCGDRADGRAPPQGISAALRRVEGRSAVARIALHRAGAGTRSRSEGAIVEPGNKRREKFLVR
mmetsp:Transcript_90147/g.270909  ORF Transcript_90147/g.270909 Transcript_90147/m.270909 type:complete len:211 (+) Transcript_90147:808-1440(+)